MRSLVGARAFDGRIGWFCEQNSDALAANRRNPGVFAEMYVNR